jgi:precorrin-2 dehydrogenase / sirohydrochlorin ferrochelatase
LIAEKISAVVVGGGVVATRKALSLHEAGAFVRVIAREATPELRRAATDAERLMIELRDYAGVSDIADAELVIAATGTDADKRIARDARELHRIFLVAGSPEIGNFTSMAVHRAGLLAIGVSAGGIPAAAMRIRDAIADRFDSRYADALSACTGIRSGILAEESTPGWAERSSSVIAEDFCQRVENGTFARVVEECR